MNRKRLISIITTFGCVFSCMNFSTYAETYADGTYTGSATGMNDNITVEVSVSNGEIASIKIVSQQDDEPYITDASEVINRIIAEQSTSVDVVSGATYSSDCIINAVKNALSSAEVSKDVTTTESISSDNDNDVNTTTTTTSSSNNDDDTNTTNATSSSKGDSVTTATSSTTINSEDTSLNTNDKSIMGIVATALLCTIATVEVSKVKKKYKK